jgi:hypothetical protein
MADDDIMLPDHLALMRHIFENPAVQWAYSQALWVSADGIDGPDLTNLHIAEEREAFAKQNTISGTVFAYRRSAFDTTRPWPEDVVSSADWRMMKRLLRAHGPDALARVGRPTLLHFPAGKKKERRDSYFSQLAAWLEMADAAPWWPAALRAFPAPGQLAQAWYLERLEREPGFLAELRRGVDTIVARAALERLAPRFTQAGRAELQQSLEAEQAKVRELERTVAELEGRTAKLSEELAFGDMLLGPGKP